MIIQKINKKVSFTYMEWVLPSNIGKTCAKLQKEFRDMVNEPFFKVTFIMLFGQG
jgi:hypothetical protein